MKQIVGSFGLALGIVLALAACAQVSDETNLSSQAGGVAPSRASLSMASTTAKPLLSTNLGAKETFKLACPLQFNDNSLQGSFLKFSATGKSPKPCFNSSTQSLGVASTGESTAKKSTVDVGESLTLEIGYDATVGFTRAPSATVRLKKIASNTSFDAKFYDGTTLLGTKRYTPTGLANAVSTMTLSLTGKEFTSVNLKPVTGSFGVNGPGNAVLFNLRGIEKNGLAYGYFKFLMRHVQESSRSGPGTNCEYAPIDNGFDRATRNESLVTHIWVMFDAYRDDSGILRLIPRKTLRGFYQNEIIVTHTTQNQFVTSTNDYAGESIDGDSFSVSSYSSEDFGPYASYVRALFNHRSTSYTYFYNKTCGEILYNQTFRGPGGGLEFAFVFDKRKASGFFFGPKYPQPDTIEYVSNYWWWIYGRPPTEEQLAGE